MKTIVDINQANFETEVLKSGQPVVLDFSTPDCGPCKMLVPVLEEIATEMAGRVKIAKVDAIENQELAVRFRIQAFPTLLYIANGEVRGQTRGAASKKAIVAKINVILAVK